MKPFRELTHRGRTRRYRVLAKKALTAFGITDAELRFIRDSGNITFRVIPSTSVPFEIGSRRFYRNHCILRLHQPGYQTTGAIKSELEWLAALCKDTDLGVPEPIRTLNDELTVVVESPGVPYPYRCSLLRWVTGRMLTKGLRPHHMRALGRLIAGLHTHTASWQFPEGFTRPRYDWNGLFGDNDFVKVPANQVWSQIPGKYSQSFESVTSQVREAMDAFGQDSDAFGLIHADIGVGANTLFGGGEARAIDFDDCAFGYWMFDLGVAMSDMRKEDAYPIYRDAVLAGYREIRELPEEQTDHLELFIATWHAFEVYWATASGILFPDHREGYGRWVERAAGDMMRYFDDC
jgi:Ser/Thr protein kinase RdoA (MazF antagonist)